MLTNALASSIVSLLLANGSGDTNNDSHMLYGAPQIQTRIDCGHPPRPDCMEDLKVLRPKVAPTSNAGAGQASPTPAPLPPTCHYESLLPPGASYPYLDSSDSGPAVADIQREDCPPGAQPIGTPLKVIMAVPRPATSPQTVADEAYKRMVMPSPQIVMTPAVDATQVVSLPIWLQITPRSWVPQSTTVSAAGVSLTMNAVPVSAVWSMGDGTTVTCRGPGAPYPAVRPKDPMAASPDCGHAYTAPSESLPQGSYPVSVTTHWKVTWSTTTGVSGAEPDLAAVASTRLRVAEIQALVTKVSS